MEHSESSTQVANQVMLLNSAVQKTLNFILRSLSACMWFILQMVSVQSNIRKGRCFIASTGQYETNRYNIKSLIRCASLCLHDMSCATVTYTPASQLCSLLSICQFTSEDCSASLSVTGLYKTGQCKYM